MVSDFALSCVGCEFWFLVLQLSVYTTQLRWVMGAGEERRPKLICLLEGALWLRFERKLEPEGYPGTQQDFGGVELCV